MQPLTKHRDQVAGVLHRVVQVVMLASREGAGKFFRETICFFLVLLALLFGLLQSSQIHAHVASWSS